MSSRFLCFVRQIRFFLVHLCVCLIFFFVDLARAQVSFRSVCFIACMTVAGSFLFFLQFFF